MHSIYNQISREAGLSPDFAKSMRRALPTAPWFVVILMLILACVPVIAQSRSQDNQDLGPVVRAYLGYLKNEQEVVDDRVSRREISQTYYRRNSNRIRALREM